MYEARERSNGCSRRNCELRYSFAVLSATRSFCTLTLDGAGTGSLEPDSVIILPQRNSILTYSLPVHLLEIGNQIFYRFSRQKFRVHEKTAIYSFIN